MGFETNTDMMQAYSGSTSPQDQNNKDNVLAELFIYLFSIMCAGNDTCSDVFEIACSLMVAAGGFAVATIPIQALTYQEDKQKVAKFAMGTLLAASIVGGIYAAHKEYHHYLRNIPYPDGVDKLSAVADASLGGAMVGTAFTCISAGIVHVTTPTITRMYNSIKSKCTKDRSDYSYTSLDEETNAHQQANIGRLHA